MVSRAGRKLDVLSRKFSWPLANWAQEVREAVFPDLLADHVGVLVSGPRVDATPDTRITDFVGDLRVARPPECDRIRRIGVARLGLVRAEEQLQHPDRCAFVGTVAGRVIWMSRGHQKWVQFG